MNERFRSRNCERYAAYSDDAAPEGAPSSQATIILSLRPAERAIKLTPVKNLKFCEQKVRCPYQPADFARFLTRNAATPRPRGSGGEAFSQRLRCVSEPPADFW